jgi:hypothetical protein
MAHAGTANGRLIVTYTDFQKWGIRRESIPGAIEDAHKRGLIYVGRGRRSYGSKRSPNTYGLGWLPHHDGTPAANRWLWWSGSL